MQLTNTAVGAWKISPATPPPPSHPDWWIDSRGVDPTHSIPNSTSYGINRPYVTGSDQSFNMNCNVTVTNTANPYDLGIDGGENVGIFRSTVNHDIPLYDSNNQLSSYKIRFSYGEYMDSTEEQWEPYASISLYDGDTYIQYVGGSGYQETDTYAVRKVIVFAGADTFRNSNNSTSHVIYGGFALILDYGGISTQHYVRCSGGAIDLAWLETTYGVHLGSDWLS